MEATAPHTVTLIHGDSGNTEWYTPEWILDGARAVMGSIDLDPASSAVANARVQAGRYFTEADDGLAQPWTGNVWLNHPFGREANRRWIDKLVEEYTTGNVTQACCICYASTSEQWFQPLLAFPICFLRGRVNYIQPNGKPKIGVSKGSCVTYLGPSRQRFQPNLPGARHRRPSLPSTVNSLEL